MTTKSSSNDSLISALYNLEQAINKTYKMVNDSVDAKRNTFNHDLLKTIDQSLHGASQGLDKMLQNAAKKIQNMDINVLNQSIQKNAMAATQRECIEFKKFNQLMQRQLNSFSSFNVALHELITKFAPMTAEQKSIQTANFAKAHGVDYTDVSMFQQYTSRHNVSREQSLQTFADIKKNLFNPRNSEDFAQDPFIEALGHNDEAFVRKLKNTTRMNDFILLLIEKISKAYQENNQELLQKLPDYLKNPGITATFADKAIHAPTQYEIEHPELFNRNVVQNASINAQLEKRENEEMEKKGYYYRSQEAKNEGFAAALTARNIFYKEYLDSTHQDYIKTFHTNYLKAVGGGVQDNINNQYDKEYQNDPALTLLGVLPQGDGLQKLSKLAEENIWGYFYSPSYDEKGPLSKTANTILESDTIYKNLMSKKDELTYASQHFSFGKEADKIQKDLSEINRKIAIRTNKLLAYQLPINSPKNQNPFTNIDIVKAIQRNRQFTDMMIMRGQQKAMQGTTINVHNHNKFSMTFNGNQYNPNHFMDSTNRQISKLTNEIINAYKSVH